MLAWKIFVGVAIGLWAIYWGVKLVESILTKNYFFGFFDYVFEEQMMKLLKVFAPLALLLVFTQESVLMIAGVLIMAAISIPYFIWFFAIVLYAIIVEPIVISIKKSIEVVKVARSK